MRRAISMFSTMPALCSTTDSDISHGGKRAGSQGRAVSRPYIIKDGLSPVTLKRGSAHAVSKLNCIQVLVPISLISIHIHRNALRKGTIESLDKTIIWGLYLVVNTLWVFIRKQTSLTKLDRKLEPRSERSVCGSPWRDIIFLTKKVCNNNYLNVRDSKTFHPTGTVICENHSVLVLVGRFNERAKAIDSPAVTWTHYRKREQWCGVPTFGTFSHGTGFATKHIVM